MAKELEPLGLLTGLDKAIFASYCQAWSIWAMATEKIRETGWVIKASTGTPMLNPYKPIMDKANEQMVKSLIEIGMSPSSRSRVKITEKRPADPAEDFLNEGIDERKRN